MRIGIDIDGVLTNIEQFSVDYFSKYLIENNVDYNISNSSYSVAKSFNVHDKIEDSFWEEYLEFYAKEESARAFASEVIKKLKNNGNEIYIITARSLTNRDDEIGENMRTIVKEWLIKNNIIYDKLIFSKGKNEEKLQEIKENKIDVMIEDNPDNINQLSAVVPIICYDTNYNRTCNGKNIYRCYSWYDIYKKIQDL